MVTVCPSTVMFPWRELPVELTRRSTLIVPPPVPLPPETIVVQGWSFVAVHAHAASVVTVMFCAGAPVASNVSDPGATPYVHPLAWLTVNVCPSMTMLALRAGPVLAAALKLIVV
jgi:hypothetical protein